MLLYRPDIWFSTEDDRNSSVVWAKPKQDVKRIKGVSRVIDNIEVQPLSPMDNQVRAAVYRAIYGDPALSDRYGFSSGAIHSHLGEERERGVGGRGRQLHGQKYRRPSSERCARLFSVTNDLVAENELAK